MELPGIEPATKISLSCRNAEIDDAKRREMTRNDLRIHRKVLMASTCRSRLPRCYRTHPVQVPGATGPAPNGPGLLLSDLAVWDGHVAMVVGNGMMIEAGDRVQLSPIRTTNAGRGFHGFFRPRPDNVSGDSSVQPLPTAPSAARVARWTTGGRPRPARVPASCCRWEPTDYLSQPAAHGLADGDQQPQQCGRPGRERLV